MQPVREAGRKVSGRAAVAVRELQAGSGHDESGGSLVLRRLQGRHEPRPAKTMELRLETFRSPSTEAKKVTYSRV